MEFDVRCRLCGDVELLGPRVCRGCRKVFALGAAAGALLALVGHPGLTRLVVNYLWTVLRASLLP